MRFRIPRELPLALLALVALTALHRSADAGDVLRTLELSRPPLAPNEIRAKGGSLLGPGGARRYAGQFGLTPISPQDGDLNTISNAVVRRNAPGCGTPTVTVVGDSLKITWPTDCVDPGEYVTIQFTASDSATDCGSGKWRDEALLDIEDADCGPARAPGSSALTVAMLAALLAVSGLLVTRRREWASARG